MMSVIAVSLLPLKFTRFLIQVGAKHFHPNMSVAAATLQRYEMISLCQRFRGIAAANFGEKELKNNIERPKSSSQYRLLFFAAEAARRNRSFGRTDAIFRHRLQFVTKNCYLCANKNRILWNLKEPFTK